MTGLLEQYADKFNDNYPIYFVIHLDEAEIAESIQRAIDSNEPYVADYINGCVY